MEIQSYKCPNCGGGLVFDPKTQKFKCEYCLSAFTEETLREMEEAARKSEEASKPGGMPEAEKIESQKQAESKMVLYTCPSCGAELLCDESTAATSCPYCGNPTVVPGQFSGELKPDFILPFRLGKEDAVKALKEHCKGKILLPKAFTNENHVQEIRGVYVPFWMFDGKAQGDARYEATRSHSYTSGDYEITKTEHYDVYRAGSVTFEKVPVDASSKMPDDHMDSIEPYDYDELKNFSTAYLPGFLADKYDVSVEESRERADERCMGTLDAALLDSVKGYDTCTRQAGNTDLVRGKVHYALMPVWMLNTRWNGKDFLFAMNGQTGKLVGDLPVSWGKFWGMFAGIAALLSIVGSIGATLLMM